MLPTSYKYIFRELIIPFVMGVVVFTFILIMFQLLKFAEFIIVHNVDYGMIFRLVYYLVVAFLPITVPVSFLFSVLITFSRLSNDSEITAFKASGISIYQLMIPVMSISIFAGVLTFYVSFYDGPWGNRNFENTIHKIGSSRTTIQVKEGIFNEDLAKDFMIYVGKIIPEKDMMQDVFIYDDRDKSNPVVITAKSSNIKIDLSTKKTELFLYDGFINFIDKNVDAKYRKADFDVYKILVHEGTYVKDRTPNLPSMTYDELRKGIYSPENKEQASWKNKMLVEFNRRFAIPFACIIFGFLGVALGNTNNRNVQVGSGFLSFLIMIAYWVLYIVSTSMGAKGSINPAFSAWAANIIFSIFAIYLFEKKV
jgi:lipopolysaccharide export system permease protein